jgi:glucose-1-phosphate thymidylyltransferase short form
VTDEYSRPATLEDLKALIASLNAQAVDYLLIGGYALFAHGYHRATTDIDVLVPATQEAGIKIRSALMVLPDQAAKDIDPAWFDEGENIRVADAFVVDIMLNACGETYETLKQYAETVDLDGVPVRTINLEGLLLTKQTKREKDVKGIILAGGSGTRLHPVTLGVSKQLLPIYDKPMIYYPLTTLMLAGIRDILIISTPQDTPRFEQLLGDGSQWGINPVRRAALPDGLAQAFSSAKTSSAMTRRHWCSATTSSTARFQRDARGRGAARGRHRLRLPRHDPERYGVVEFDAGGRRSASKKSRKQPKSNYAVTGLYFYDNRWSTWPAAQALARGELEITDLNRSTSNRASSTSRSWAAATPGSTPAPTNRCSKPASSSPPSKSARA